MKAFVFDLDGTLIVKGTSDIKKSSFEALDLIKKQGDLVIIATGRANYTVPDSLKAYADYLITYNGQSLSNKETYLFNNYLNKDKVAKLIEIYKKYNSTYNLKRPDAYHMFGDYEYAYNFEIRYNKDFGEFFIKGTATDNVYSSFLYEKSKETVLKIKEELKELSLDVLKSYDNSYDIVDSSSSKLDGLTYLKKDILKDYTTYGFGDGENDVTFLMNVDYPHCLEDGSKLLKSHITNIIGPSNSDTLYETICKIYNV